MCAMCFHGTTPSGVEALLCVLQGVVGVPLPCGPEGVSNDTLYDLHTAHAASGATDTAQVNPFGAVRSRLRSA